MATPASSRLVKIQGSRAACLQRVQAEADRSEGVWRAQFGVRDVVWVNPRSGGSASVTPTSVFFQWRSEYGEFDNSC